MRRLVFCFDGSWNGLQSEKEPTNVLLLAEAVMPSDKHKNTQMVYYDEGVGTASDEVWRGGVFGKGLVENIREAYRFLIFNYQAGDEIFIFGFSRGGFTAASFAGFLRCAGIIEKADARQIDQALQLYMANARRTNDDSEELRQFRKRYCGSLCVDEADQDWRTGQSDGLLNTSNTYLLKIKYLGLWDMVGSIGWDVVKSFFDRSSDKEYSRHDTNLSLAVESARHAVSIDERRIFFMPTLWKNLRTLNSYRQIAYDHPRAPYQQQWFPGDHGSVGGGGSERGLSNAALHWILEGAVLQGLAVNLEGRSQLTTIRYDQRTSLQNTPLSGFDKLKLKMKSAFISASRSGPQEVSAISPAALRRWFTAQDELPEMQPYRPQPLKHLESEIDKQSRTFLPREHKDSECIEHVVVSGDTLSKIAQKYCGDASRYQEIFEYNRDKLDSVHHIFPGDQLRIPRSFTLPE